MTSATPTALEGIKILELADASGVHCGKLLADMGASIIKIEKPGGDDTRRMPPFVGNDPHHEKSLFFLYYNANKRGITLNLETADGRELFRRLVEKADVLIETTPVGYLKGLGLDYAELSKLNSSLVMTSITGFGQTGPFANFKSSDMVAWAMGMMQIICGQMDYPPLQGAGYQSYMTGCMAAATATLIAVYHQILTGEGQQVDISLQEAVLTLTPEMGIARYFTDLYPQPRPGHMRAGAAAYGTFQCQDGWVYIVPNVPAHWESIKQWMVEVTGNDAIMSPEFTGPTGSSNRLMKDAINALVTEFTLHLPMEQLFKEGQEQRHFPITPVNSPADVVNDPNMAARGFFVEIDHPVVGRLSYPGAPYKHQASPWSLRRPAPTLGQHNQEVYVDELGLPQERLALLRAAGVI